MLHFDKLLTIIFIAIDNKRKDIMSLFSFILNNQKIDYIFASNQEMSGYNSFSKKKVSVDKKSFEFNHIYNLSSKNFFKTFSEQINVSSGDLNSNVSVFSLVNKIWSEEDNFKLYQLMQKIVHQTLISDKIFKKTIFDFIQSPSPDKRKTIINECLNNKSKMDCFYIIELLSTIKPYRKKMRDNISSILLQQKSFSSTHEKEILMAYILQQEHCLFSYFFNISRNQEKYHSTLEFYLNHFPWFNSSFEVDENFLNFAKTQNINFNQLSKNYINDNKKGLRTANKEKQEHSYTLNFVEFNILLGKKDINLWLYQNNYRETPQIHNFIDSLNTDNVHTSKYQRNFISYQYNFLNKEYSERLSVKRINRL